MADRFPADEWQQGWTAGAGNERFASRAGILARAELLTERAERYTAEADRAELAVPELAAYMAGAAMAYRDAARMVAER